MSSSAVSQKQIGIEGIPEIQPLSEVKFNFAPAIRSYGVAGIWLGVLSDFGLLSMSAIAGYFLSNTGRLEVGIILAGVLSFAALSSKRGFRQDAAHREPKRDDGRRVLIVGSGRIGMALASYFEDAKAAGYQFVGFLDERKSTDPGTLGKPVDLLRVTQKYFIDEVFLTAPSDAMLTGKLWADARAAQINLSVVVSPQEAENSASPGSHAAIHPVVVLHRSRERFLARIIKRELDVLSACILLTVFSPLLLAVAIAVKLESKGSVLYRSRRMGKRGRLFTCYKFRTMVCDAHALREGLTHLNECEKILFKIRSDPRITALGRVLRKYSLDELPQLWNVLVGDMSLVGPRPPLPEEYEQYSMECRQRLRVKPGITGLWQVTARQNPSFDVYMNLDLQYVESWSLWWDLKILLLTIPAVIRGTGW